MLSKEFLEEVLFPYSDVRAYQDGMISDVDSALKNKKHIIMHAPTGIGKTASVLAPCLAHALKNGLNVLFLTSRHMQHQIVIKTLKEIKNKYGAKFECADLIGKKWMCLQHGSELMNSNDFHQYCRSLREEDKCEFYLNSRNKNGSPAINARITLDKMKNYSPCNVHEIVDAGKKGKLCPYELGIMMGNNSKVVITDYYYVFNPAIRQSFMLKINKELDKCILIVDEGHNLPTRIRELLSNKLSTFMIERALREAKKYGHIAAIENINIINNALIEVDSKIVVGNETIANKAEFVSIIEKQKGYKKILEELSGLGEEIVKDQKNSYILGIAKFMEAWIGEEEGFTRVVTRYEKNVSLKLKCLDPSIVSKEVIEESYCTLLMSGTLTPTSMYKDILGFPEDTSEKEYQNPFPKNNRLAMVVPKTTTKFSKRSSAQFYEIGKICGDICSKIKGNSIVFFPSYELMNFAADHFRMHYEDIMLIEKKHLNREEKEKFLESFKGYRNAAMLAVSSGSFGEGVDMPGILKGVIIVGLPLQKPDLETLELIKYYQQKFSMGWDYGYILPAVTRCMQNAGRCIRSEKDKGVIIFLDERYAWENYLRCFPKEWDVKVEENYEMCIKEFFK